MGAGALGSVFGGFLARAGYDVTLLGRPWHLQAVKQEGLSIEGIWGDYVVSGFSLALSAGELTGPFDLILVTVKSNDTRTMAMVAKNLLAPGGLVVSLQNGLGNGELLAEEIGRERCAAGRVIFGAEILSPGRVRVTVCADDVVIGPLGKGYSSARLEAIRECAAIINNAGIPCRYSDEVQVYLWAKALYNCALNPLGALLEVNYGALADHEGARYIMERIIDEAFAVARSRGVSLPWPDAQVYKKEFYEKMLPPTRNHRPSMLQDLERGRRTEIDALNGKIVDYGRKAGIATPVNETIRCLVKFRERMEIQHRK